MSRFDPAYVRLWDSPLDEERKTYCFVKFVERILGKALQPGGLSEDELQTLRTPSDNEQFNKIQQIIVNMYELKVNLGKPYVSEKRKIIDKTQTLKDEIFYEAQCRLSNVRPTLERFKDLIFYKDDKYSNLKELFLDFNLITSCVMKFSGYAIKVMGAIIDGSVTPSMEKWLNTPLSDKQDEFRLILKEMKIHKRNANRTELSKIRYKFEKMILNYINIFDKKIGPLELNSNYDAFSQNACVKGFDKEYECLFKKVYELQRELKTLSYIIKKLMSGKSLNVRECAYLRIPLRDEKLNKIRLSILKMYEYGDKNRADKCIRLFNEYVFNISEKTKKPMPVFVPYESLFLNDDFRGGVVLALRYFFAQNPPPDGMNRSL